MIDQGMLDEVLNGGEVTDSEMFELLMCTSWGDMRFKPPPSLDSPMGWRTEFRTADSVLTER